MNVLSVLSNFRFFTFDANMSIKLCLWEERFTTVTTINLYVNEFCKRLWLVIEINSVLIVKLVVIIILIDIVIVLLLRFLMFEILLIESTRLQMIVEEVRLLIEVKIIFCSDLINSSSRTIVLLLIVFESVLIILIASIVSSRVSRLTCRRLIR